MNPSVAVVTGATEGIGRAIAFALGKGGYRVGLAARTQGSLDAVRRDLEKEGVTTSARPTDVADPQAVSRLVEQVTRDLGPIDTLVNNAGIAVSKPLVDTTVEEWDRVFAVNVRGMFLMSRAVLPGMQARGSGDIVNIASLAGRNGVVQMSAYSASKHAVLGLSRSLMLEVRKLGIRVIAICPGSVDTSLIQRQTAFQPNLERILRPEDVAAAVVDALRMPRRAMISELDIRPSNP